MSLPGDLTTTRLAGTYLDSAGFPQQGTVRLTPSAVLADATGSVVIPMATRVYQISAQGEFETDPLVATDNATISPQGWTYTVQVIIADLPPQEFSILLPTSGSPVDISTITPAVPQAAVTSYLPQSGGSLAGTLTLNGSPPLRIPTGATSGDVLTSDSSGNATWGPVTVSSVAAADITGTVQITQGGTGATSAGAALTALGAASSSALSAETSRAEAAESANASAISAETSRAETAEAALLPLAGGTMAGAIAMGLHKVTGLANGTISTDAAAFGQIPVIDTTATDIQPAGTQAAGSTGKAADAGHAHPGSWWIPADSGLLAANFDPVMASGATATLTAGQIYFLQVQIRYPFTWSNIVVSQATTGSGTSTGSYVGLYSSSGTQVAVSADCASYFTGGSNTTQVIPLSSPYAATAGTFLWVALLSNLGTTQPALGKNNASQWVNVGYSIASNPIYLRAAKYATGSQTSLPASFTPSSALSSSGETAYWVGGA